MSDSMRAMRLHAAGKPLELEHVARPTPGPGDVQVRVLACGVCRTDLHVLDGELSEPRLPLIPGHEIVGEVTALGEGVQTPAPGTRVGVPWLGWTCGDCVYCRAGQENLCENARFTGYTLDGGYADFAPLGHSVRVRRDEEKGVIAWRIKFRNGKKDMDLLAPITTKPWGKHIPQLKDVSGPSKEMRDSQLLFNEPKYIRLDDGDIHTLESNGLKLKEGVYY